MSAILRRFCRKITLPFLILVGVAALLYFLVPIAKWLIVDRTLAVYQEAAGKYSTDGDLPTIYEGEIIDTIIRPSVKIKGAIDTTLHKQTIRISPKDKTTDGKPKADDVGVFGDSAGLLNAFFSFLAFVAVLVTIYLQNRKDDHDKRNGARVQFEQEFFAMVGMLEEIVAHLKFTDHENVKNDKFIKGIADDLLKKYGLGSPKGKNDSDADKYKPIVVEGREVFEYLYKDRENYNLLKYLNSEDSNSSYSSDEAQRMCFDGTLDHYFRYLYRILKHIDETELLNEFDDPESERERYAHLLRAQLSNYELLMWFYNGLLGEEHPRTVKKLIERYAMFNNLRAWELGKKDIVYYQNILEGEMYEDPVDFDKNTKYSVNAFWSKKKLRELKKKIEKEQKGPGLCDRLKQKRKKGQEIRKKNESKERGNEEAKPDTQVERPPIVNSKPKEKEKQSQKPSKKGNNNPKKRKDEGRKPSNKKDKLKDKLRKNK